MEKFESSENEICNTISFLDYFIFSRIGYNRLNETEKE